MEYAFGDFILDLNRGELRGSGGPISMEPRAFALLTYMLENQGRLVEKEELVNSVWDGRIVSDSAISTAIKVVRRALNDDGKEQTWMKTVRGRGFRFDGEVRSQVPEERATVQDDQVQVTDAQRLAPKALPMAIFDRPSVLVVGFDCLGNDGRDSSLALGLAQEVRLNLSYWRWFPVIGPEALGFKTAGEIDVREKARDLGAAYALTGAVRSLGEKVRVNVTLTSVDDGNSIWSRHFDGTLENLFDFEEEVSRAIVAQIEPEISRANSQRLSQSRPTDLSAWQLLLKAGQVERRGGEGYGTPEANEEQKALLTEALKKEAGLARAWAWLAKCHWRETIMGWVPDREEALSASLDASQTALEINPTNWEARSYRALALIFGRKEFVESEFHAREAVRLNPSDASARHCLGCVLENVGKTDEALDHLEAVFRLNPNHSNTSAVMGDIVTCHMLLGNHVEAIDSAVRLIALAPNYSRGIQRAIAALAHAGEVERAGEAVARLHNLQPDFNENYVRTTYPFKDPETLELFVFCLRKAGAFDVLS